MHRNAIKIVGGVKFSKIIPQNVGFFDQKVWDFWPKRGERFLRMGICGINSKRGGF